MIHSVSMRVEPVPCETIIRLPRPDLRPYVAGYGGFRAKREEPVPRRMLPLSLATMIIDFATPRLVTGPRSTPLLFETGWRSGVAVGLTPAGARALLGLPMRQLTDATLQLADLLGHRAVRLADRLGEEPDWATRFAVLDDTLASWLSPSKDLDGPVTHAWWRLHESAGRIRIGELADELRVSRRSLESGFRKELGLSPKTIARIARFQRAAHVLSRQSAALGTAVACGYADQPHFTREVRRMSGLTPKQLCAFLQYSNCRAD